MRTDTRLVNRFTLQRKLTFENALKSRPFSLSGMFVQLSTKCSNHISIRVSVSMTNI